MKMIGIILLLICVSCGSNKPSTTSDNINHPIIVDLKPPTTQINHKTYIIGGQSNGAKLLGYLNGVDPQAVTFISDYPLLNDKNISGYAISGTSSHCWSDDGCNPPLLKIISNYCYLNPYFIWWQGEADALNDQTAINFRENTIKFFNEVKSICPNIFILEVIIEDSTLPAAQEGRPQIQLIQQTLGDAQISGKGFLMQDWTHVSAQGYQDFFDNLSQQYPLN